MSQAKEGTSTGPTQLLRGTITNYRKTRRSQDFMFTQADRDKMGATAIAAGVVGLGGIAVGLAAAGMDTTEAADLLEFNLDGKAIRAWVWLSVFGEGDEVEVVAEPMGDVWQGYGVRRLADKIVALHPHCSRGRLAHYKATFESWAKWGGGLVAIPLVLFAIYVIATSPRVNWIGLLIVLLSAGGLALVTYGVIAYRIAKKFMNFVRLAEGIFSAFGWNDVKNIDLPAITKKSKQPSDPGALGILYFRY